MSADERRCETRVTCARPVRVGEAGHSEKAPAAVVNVSEQGARLHVAEPVAIGRMVYVEFALRKRLGGDTVPGMVTWATHISETDAPSDLPSAIGVSFLVRQWRLPEMVVADAVKQAKSDAAVAAAADQRRARRFPCELEILVRKPAGAGEALALAVDVSDCGVRVFREEPIEPQDLVYVVFSAREGLHADTVPSIVRWCECVTELRPHPYAHLTSAAGLEFIQRQFRRVETLAHTADPTRG